MHVPDAAAGFSAAGNKRRKYSPQTGKTLRVQSGLQLVIDPMLALNS